LCVSFSVAAIVDLLFSYAPLGPGSAVRQALTGANATHRTDACAKLGSFINEVNRQMQKALTVDKAANATRAIPG
jgi:hypothetical protein